MYTVSAVQPAVHRCLCMLVCLHISTHMKGLSLPVLGPDLWLSDGCEVGAAHRQQSSSTVKEEQSSWLQ